MTKTRFLFAILLTWMIADSSLAEPLAPGESWPQILRGLQDKGIHDVGAFDVDQFLRDGQNPKKLVWKTNPKAAPSVIAGERTSAFYVAEQKNGTVYLSTKNLPKDALESVPDLELHEALGALGFEDDKYTKSSALRLLLDLPESRSRDKLIENLGTTVFSKKNLKIQGRDGGSSVGGGGDIRALMAKRLVLAEILKESGSVSTSFLLSYPEINFEVLDMKNFDYITISYRHHGPEAIKKMGLIPRLPVRNGRQELITFYIPGSVWSKGGSTRKKLIKELKTKVTGIYPADPKARSSMKIQLCGGRAEMSFPQTRDRDVYIIQTARGEALSKCDGMEEASRTTEAPGLPREEILHESGIAYYVCDITQGGRLLNTEKIAGVLGTGVIQHMRIGTLDHKELTGLAWVDHEGYLRKMLIYPAGADLKDYLSKFKVFPDRSESGSLTTKLVKPEVKISCQVDK